MLQQNAEYSPAGETKDEGHVLRPPSLTLQTGRKQSGSGPTVQYRSGARPSVGGKTACWDPMWHLAPSRTTRSENNLLGGQTPVFLSDVTEPGFRNGLTGFHGNRIPLLTAHEISPFRQLLLLSATSQGDEVPPSRCSSGFSGHRPSPLTYSQEFPPQINHPSLRAVASSVL